MPGKSTWQKVEAGLYQSRDGRATLQRKISRQTGHPNEICWGIVVDGREQVVHEDTLREAKNVAFTLLKGGS